MKKIKKPFMWFKIPTGIYCHSNKKTCPYWEHIKVITFNKSNCEFANSCNENCEQQKCKCRVTRCEYMDFTDEKEDSLLWDQCKECNVKYGYNLKDWLVNKLYEWKILK